MPQPLPPPPLCSLSAPVPHTLAPPSARLLLLTIVSQRREYAAAVRGRASSPAAADSAWRALADTYAALLSRSGARLPPGTTLDDVRASLDAAEAARRARRKAVRAAVAAVAFLVGRAVRKGGGAPTRC